MSAKNLFVVRAIVCAGMLLTTADRSVAATISIKAVKINDAPIAPSAQVSIQPGDTIEAEFYVSGWNQNLTGSRLLTFQFTLDRLGWISGSRGTILPAGWNAALGMSACQTSVECPPDQPQCDETGFCLLRCTRNADCPTEYPICSPERGASCIGVGHAPEVYAFIDGTRPGFAHFGFFPIFAVRTVDLDFAFGSTALSGDGPFDNGAPRYVGTLTLHASADACGTFKVDLIPEIHETFVELIDGQVDFAYAPAIAPLSVHVACQTSACCTPRNPCENTSRADCTARSGTWQEGKFCGEGDQTCPRVSPPRNPGAQ